MTTIDATSFTAFNQSPLVFTSRLLRVSPVRMSTGEPPFLHAVLHFAPATVLRGSIVPPELHLFRTVEDQPELPSVTDRVWLVAATRIDEVGAETIWVINALMPTEDAHMTVATQALEVPIGWTMTGGQLVSPWPALGQPRGLAGPPVSSPLACALSRRPALLAGADIAVTIQTVRRSVEGQPRRVLRDLQLTVTNQAAVPREVPVLLTDGTTILWADSVLVLSQDGFFWLPGWERHVSLLPGVGTASAVLPVRLQPGESVTTLIDDAVLRQMLHAAGCRGRVHLQFCLGEHSASYLYVQAPSVEEREAARDTNLLAHLNQAQVVFTGRRRRPPAGNRYLTATTTNPPTYFLPVQFDDVQVLRGRSDPTGCRFIYMTRRIDALDRPAADRWLVGMSEEGSIAYLAPAEARRVEIAKQAIGLPVGWLLDKGEPISPWTVLASPLMVPPAPTSPSLACARSGRPAWPAGEQIELTSAQVLPAQQQAYGNPFGDGKFTIRVTNRGDTLLEVPALRTDGHTILWADSLLVLSESVFSWLPGWGRLAYLLPGAGHAQGSRPVRLRPGESVATVVDVLPLTRLQPRMGGGRIYYQFCLGELSTINFFYFSRELHDPLREAGGMDFREERSNSV